MMLAVAMFLFLVGTTKNWKKRNCHPQSYRAWNHRRQKLKKNHRPDAQTMFWKKRMKSLLSEMKRIAVELELMVKKGKPFKKEEKGCLKAMHQQRRNCTQPTMRSYGGRHRMEQKEVKKRYPPTTLRQTEEFSDDKKIHRVCCRVNPVISRVEGEFRRNPRNINHPHQEAQVQKQKQREFRRYQHPRMCENPRE
ncbi:hypothetical protein TcCL_NonESM11321 [Trypanosoma cruzi]|nr:hypothetical protein TcCL_NonESM11321 [Trypanosoma cruzi]